LHADIEKAIAAGVSHEKIISTLSVQGLGDIPLATFRSALYRMRKNKIASSGPVSSMSGGVKQPNATPLPPAQANPQRQAADVSHDAPLSVSEPSQRPNPHENTQPYNELTPEKVKTMSWNELRKRDVPWD
jgi:hypothetical protein